MTRGTLDLTFSDGSKQTFGKSTSGFPDVAASFLDARVARDILLDPRLALGESYMEGRISIERGDIMEFILLMHANRPFEAPGELGRASLPARVQGSLKVAYRSINKPGSAKKNVAHHYDIGNALYEIMLDPEHMQYSCAYWPRDDMTLGEAQEAKLAHIAAKLNIQPGNKVLDIGCGWGGMAIFLAKRMDVEVLGITLSEEQVALARKRAEEAGVADKVRFELVDYRDLAKQRQQFDRIVSVGMFEHVGTPQYETFFRSCANMLKDDGAMLVHTIGRMGPPGYTDAFTDKWIFPGGYIPALSETAAASEKIPLIITDVEILRLHYNKTLRCWYDNVVENRDKIVELFDERFFRLWTFYLAGATAAFEYGSMVNFQIQYVRQRRALPLTRGYMEQTEEKLLGK